MKNNNFLDIYKGSLLAFILKSLSILSGYFLALIISKYYGSDGMGLYSISYTLLLVFCIVSVMGFDAASIKFVSENTSLHVIRSIYFKILKIIVPVSILVSLFVFVFTFIAEDIFVNKNTIINLRYVSLGILPLSLINIHAESFRGFKNIQLYSLFRFSLIPFFSCVILLLFDFSGYYSHSNPIQSYIFSIYIVFFLSTFSWFKKINFLKSKINIDNSYKKMLSVSLPMLLTTSMFYVIQWTDILILSYFETPSNIGIYNIALKISMASSIILFSINSIAAPKYSELFSLNKIEEFKNIVKFSSRMIFWFSIPIIFIIGLKAEFILSIFGYDFVTGKYALLILLFGQLVNVICGSVGYILMMTNKQKKLRNFVFYSAIINIILNFMLIPKYGIMGSAISSTISLSIWNLLSLSYIYKKYGFITTSVFK